MANIVLQLSTGSTSLTTGTDPNSALGGNISTDTGATITTSNTSLNNLFDNISKAENFAGTTDYRCVFIYNNDTTSGDIFANGQIYLSGSPLATFQLGLVSAKNTSAGTIANENAAPSGITFSSPTSGSPLTLMSGTNVLNPTDYIGLWIKRTANNITGSGTVTDTCNLVITGTE